MVRRLLPNRRNIAVQSLLSPASSFSLSRASRNCLAATLKVSDVAPEPGHLLLLSDHVRIEAPRLEVNGGTCGCEPKTSFHRRNASEPLDGRLHLRQHLREVPLRFRVFVGKELLSIFDGVGQFSGVAYKLGEQVGMASANSFTTVMATSVSDARDRTLGFKSMKTAYATIKASKGCG